MRSLDEGFLLLARGGRTPHTLPTHRGRGHDHEAESHRRELLAAAAPARQPRRSRAVSGLRAAGALAVALAAAVRRGSQFGA